MIDRARIRSTSPALLLVASVCWYAPQVPAQTAPFVDAGPDRTVPDTDGMLGESVTLQGSSNLGTPSTCCVPLVWTDALGNIVGTGAIPTVRLSDGVNQLTLTGTIAANMTIVADTVTITVSEKKLENLSRLPNRRSLGHAFDETCGRLRDTGNQGIPPAAELASRCSELLNEVDPLKQAKALQVTSAEQFNSFRSVTTVFSQTQFQGVMDRLVALRAGQRGLSLDRLAFRSRDQEVSGDHVIDRPLGGAAGSDDAPETILGDRLGMWLRGNVGRGEKDSTDADSGFDADQQGISGGVDYRVGRDTVLGLSLGYGNAALEFKAPTDSTLDSDSLAASLYGSAYLGQFYFDAVANYIDADYRTRRHILFTPSNASIDVTASGKSKGSTLSGGVALGYDFARGGFTLAPSAGYYYVDSTIKAFTEAGGQGLDLAFDKQRYTSSTGNASLRMSYAWKLAWAVAIPHFRGTYVREFNDAAEVFAVRFADDPFANSSNPTPPIVVTSDRVDTSYYRIAGGLSLQMKHGFAAYADYQRIVGFENVTFHDFTIGLRMQYSVR